MLETFPRDSGPYLDINIAQLLRLNCTSIMLFFCSTISQCWLLDRDLVTVEPTGVHWSHCHEMIWALWRDRLSCNNQASEDDYTVVVKGWTKSVTILRLLHLNNAQLVLKVSQANTSHTRYTTSSSLNHLYNAKVISTASVLFGPNCDPGISILEDKSHQVRQCFSNILLSSCDL